MPMLIDISGKRYGLLTVLKKAPKKNGYHGAMWHCICDCGRMTIANGQNLKSGNTTSCGCFGDKKRVASVTKHGKTGTRLYRIWKAMHTRCYNPNSFGYKYYGGKGLTICDEWKNDFTTFEKWALENGYAHKLTIDRIDNTSGYSPENCRWATMEEQNKNKTTINGYKIRSN